MADDELIRDHRQILSRQMAEIDRLRAELAATKVSLRLAIKEIEDHHSDYHHLTFLATLEKIRAPLGGMED